ncbi:MAG: hypothetical protein IKP86_09670 [Anaerolineaceae bacterium]|nr:hypothetical protein [Anaerolineaceae bacterium]
MVNKRKNFILILLILVVLSVNGTVYAFQNSGEGSADPGNQPDNGSEILTPTAEAQQEEQELLTDDEDPFDPASVSDPNELLRIADDEIFKREGFKETFWETQGYVNEVLNGDFIHQFFVSSGKASDLLMSMFPAEESVRTGNYRLNFTSGWMDDYHVSVSVLRGEDFPQGSGGCWLRYTNMLTKSKGKETGLILFPEKEAYAIAPSDDEDELVYTFVEDLSGLSLNNMIKFDFIRLSGVTFIYVNGQYLFSYYDGFDGKMSFEAGSELYEGGNRVRCDFDNFIMRYR